MLPEVQKRRDTLINLAYIAAIAAILYFIIRYALGVFMPLFIALVVGAVLQRPKNFLVRKTPLKKGAASAICVLGALIVIVALVFIIGVKLADEIKGFISYIAAQLGDLENALSKIETWLVGITSSLPEFLRKTATEGVTELFSKIRDSVSGNTAGSEADLTKQIMSALAGNFNMSWIKTPINGVISTASKLPSLFVSVIITLVASCFVTSDFHRISTFIINQFPEEKRNDFTKAKVLLRSSLGKMAKAYLQIMGITCAEMLIGLFVLNLLGIFKSSYIVLIAIGTAIIDIVPVLGTGTVIFPWALYSLIVGDYAMAIGLIIIYACISVIRQIIEPKMVAGQLGLSPVVTIFAMYAGLKMFGVLGMLIIPLLVIMIKLLNDEGIIKLWKSPPKEAEDNESEDGKGKTFNKVSGLFKRKGKNKQGKKETAKSDFSDKNDEAENQGE